MRLLTGTVSQQEAIFCGCCLGGGFETKVRFYDDYAEGSDLVDRFRLEYRTLDQILREVIFSAEV